MNVLDIGIILLFIMSFIMGVKSGAIKEICSLIGIILVFTVSFWLMRPFGSLLCKILPFFNYFGAFKDLEIINVIIYQLIAFVIVFSILIAFYFTLLKISGVIEKLVDFTIILLLPSKIIGGLVSFITGYIMIFMVLLVLMIPLKNTDVFEESKIGNYMINETPILSKSTKNITTAIEKIMTLSDNKLTMEEKVLNTLDIMLEYKIVSKDTINDLLDSKKITKVDGMSKILDKYE